MRPIKIIAAFMLLIAVLTGCGREFDDSVVIENNATAKVTAGENVFEISGDDVTMNGKLLAANTGACEEKIVVLGGKVYFNTDEGAKYINIKNGKIKKFGAGRIEYAQGRWVYYNNIDLYMINVVDGKQNLLHQRDMANNQPELHFKEDDGENLIFTDGTKDYSIKKNGTALAEI